MKLSKSLPRTVAASCLALALGMGAPLANGQQAQTQTQKDYEPQSGQQGKDVIWLPTSLTLVNAMLDLAKVTAKDYVIDLGSGDGRTVITAAKRGATALGIEYNPDMVDYAKRNAEREGVSDKATFMKADLFEADFSKATVITMFLLPSINVKLRPKILDMKPGTRIVSNSFDMGDWTPDETRSVSENCTTYCNALFWLVPAKVEGTWKLAQGELALEQKYQVVTGTLKTGNVVAPISGGKLAGDRITFTAGGAQYVGTVNGNSIEGVSRSGGAETKWQATRAGK
jgi:SAM-dependent methyltransferase